MRVRWMKGTGKNAVEVAALQVRRAGQITEIIWDALIKGGTYELGIGVLTIQIPDGRRHNGK